MNTTLPRARADVVSLLKLMSSESEQIQYQAAVPLVSVPSELFNQWDEVYFPKAEAFIQVFNSRELAALARFNAELNEICNETPQVLPPLDCFIATEEWRRLSAAATRALAELAMANGA